MKTKEVLRLLAIPLVIAAVYFLVLFLWGSFDLPNAEETIQWISFYFDRHGLMVVFITALIEGFLVIGQYFPGGFIIFLGIIAAGKNVIRVIEITLIISVAFFIAYYGNYIVGKHGWHRILTKLGFKRSLDRAKIRVRKHELKAIMFSYWDPNLSSIIATAAGILHVATKKFLLYSAIGIVVWNTFWSVLIYNLGQAALELAGAKYVIFMLSAWIIIILVTSYLKSKKEKERWEKKKEIGKLIRKIKGS
ncbi:VTT domain-containing protein [Candidatus Pacearchaeota archaeon]|nr:VTT domain-containing protein [Candidatus Pacearchaeota archaeon]